ncbi:proline-rich protein 3 isoform X2 [Cricetulus griseus]|uniref:Proline-rich protein 3 isoform X2 n=1 Tax=Cricetulus griseus TaxID=10029 RepID=A0A9J7J4V3_CRIGR|nr:proline-rich protein 3 isoform X2 [Cricetulus griseus]XP_027244434.1 proline-rich protein 3 isoform X2 [Cricetulus griseus]
MVIGRPDVATLGCDGPLARRGRPQVRQGCASPWRGGGGALPRGEEEERTTWASKPAEPPREPRGERGPQATLWRRIPAGGGGTKAWVSQPTAPPGSGNRGSVPLPHCPPSPAAAIAAATMPKRKKQNQQQPPPPPPQPARWDRDEPGDDDDDEEEEGEEESPIGESAAFCEPTPPREGEKKKKYDGPTVKDHPAFWGLPPWLMESLVIPSQTSLTALFADTFPKRATVDMKTFVPSTIRASMDLLCETVPPSHPVARHPLWLPHSYLKFFFTSSQ